MLIHYKIQKQFIFWAQQKIMLFTDLPFDCLVKVLDFVPLQDQFTCAAVWPHLCGNLLLRHKKLKIVENNQEKGADELCEKIVFGERRVSFLKRLKKYLFRVNRIEFLKILKYLSNLEEIDVVDVDDVYQQEIVEVIGRIERKKLRIIKLGKCGKVDYEAFKRMVDGVPQLEEFQASLVSLSNTDDYVRYLLTRATQLHSVELTRSWELNTDVFRCVRVPLKVLKAYGCVNLSVVTLDHILESSRDSLEELELCTIPYSGIPSLVKFRNLRVVSWVEAHDKCLHPNEGATEISCLCHLRHLEKISICGCLHDKDIRVVSRGWAKMWDFVLQQAQTPPHHTSSDALMCLRYMTSMEKMKLSYLDTVTDDHLEVFSRDLVNLKVLWLIDTSVTGKALKFLANLPKIQDIRCRSDHLFTSGEERDEVITILNAAQREKGRDFTILTSSLDELDLKV